MTIPTSFFVPSWIFPLCANFVSKNMLDGHRASDLNVHPDHMINKESVLKRQASMPEDTKGGQAEMIEGKV